MKKKKYLTVIGNFAMTGKMVLFYNQTAINNAKFFFNITTLLQNCFN